MRFYARGHPNLRAAHRTTLEFTKSSELTVKGDCIVGVSSDFGGVRDFVKGGNIFNMEIKCNGRTFTLTARANPDFDDDEEMVIRMGDFLSPRTLGTDSDKAACHIPREMVKLMQNPDAVIEVNLE
jgi:hypothetical protein